MYKLNFDGWPLYDPRGANKIDRLIILQPEVEIGVNKAGSIKFAVPPGHPNADKITKMCGTLELTDDAGVLFRGRVLDDRQTFDKSTHYTAEGALAWLNDGIVEPYDFPADFQSDPAYQAAAATGNVVAFFLGWLLDGYNAHAAPDRQIKLGNVTVADPNNYITRADSNYPSTFEVLSKKLAGSALGGYMVMRYEADGNYLDYLSTFVGTNAQEITFGENLLDLVRESTAADLYTAVLPIGADGLTLAGLPDGPQENGLVKAGKVLYNPQAEAEYGRIIRKVEYTDITLADNLLRTAAKDMGAEIRLPESLQVRACDLHYLDGKTPSFRLGLYTVVVSAPHGIVRKSYPLTDLQPNLLNPAATPITLNGAASQLTARLRQAQQAEQERTESAIRAVVKETSAILDEIIKSASGLYCTPEVQPGGSTIYYLHDKPTLAESTNVIKLTADAIGFSTDGGHNYPYGFTVTGDMVARVLSASGVNAKWIRAGVLQSVDGKTFFLDLEKGILRMEATELTISGKSVNAALQAAVTDVENQFYLSDSATVLAGGSWEPSQPTWTKDKFIWTRQYVTYGDGSTAYLPDETGVCITGNTGASGKDGRGVLSSEVTYQAAESGTVPPSGEWGDKMPPVTAGQYLWTRTVITYTDNDSTTLYTVSRIGADGQPGSNGTSTYTHIRYSASADGTGFTESPSAANIYIGVYTGTSTSAPTNKTAYTWSKYKGDKGDTGAKGNGINTITYYYAVTQTQTPPEASSVIGTTIPKLDATNKYLWQKEVIDFTDASVADKTTVILLAVYGDKGKDGTNGTNGTNGTSVTITSTSITYQASDSGTKTPSGQWSADVPEVQNGQYLWTKTVVTYSDKTSTTAYSVAYKGTNGVGIASVTNYYLASASAAGVTVETKGWDTKVQSVSSQKPYLWNYEVTAYNDGRSVTVEPHIIGTYGRDGTNGAAGKSISSITEHYLATSATGGVTTKTAGWTTDLQPTDTSKRYLWNYETILYTDGSEGEIAPRIIGTHGAPGKDGSNGKDGVGIKSIVTEYRVSPSNEHPDEDPMSRWQTDIPVIPDGYYLWTRQVITYSDAPNHVEYAGMYCLTQAMADALTDVEIMNKLTDNGRRKGIFFQDDELYVSASAIITGVLNAAKIAIAGDYGSILQGKGSTMVNGVEIPTTGLLAMGPKGLLGPLLLLSEIGARLSAKDGGTSLYVTDGFVTTQNGVLRVEDAIAMALAGETSYQQALRMLGGDPKALQVGNENINVLIRGGKRIRIQADEIVLQGKITYS